MLFLILVVLLHILRNEPYHFHEELHLLVLQVYVLGYLLILQLLGMIVINQMDFDFSFIKSRKQKERDALEVGDEVL